MEADIARVETEEDGERMGVIRYDFFIVLAFYDNDSEIVSRSSPIGS